MQHHSPFTEALRRIHREPPRWLAPAVLVAVLLVALGDLVTGADLTLSLFYLFPVLVAGWTLGRRAAVWLAVLGGVLGALASVAGPDDLHSAVVAWNAFMRTALYLVVAILVSAFADLLEAAEDRADVDVLTGCLTRRRFYAEVGSALADRRRPSRSFAMVYVDVDDLKVMNDTQGHEAGDALLASFASVVAEHLRADDRVARLGGDEFAFFLPDTGLEDAEGVVARILDALAGLGRPVHVSAGLVAGTAVAGLDVEQVIHQADALMYEVKSAGGHAVRAQPLELPTSLRN